MVTKTLLSRGKGYIKIRCENEEIFIVVFIDGAQTKVFLKKSTNSISSQVTQTTGIIWAFVTVFPNILDVWPKQIRVRQNSLPLSRLADKGQKYKE